MVTTLTIGNSLMGGNHTYDWELAIERLSAVAGILYDLSYKIL